LSFARFSCFRAKFHPGRLSLWPISQIVASIALRIGQHAQEPRAGFPRELPPAVAAPHCIATLLVNSQDLRHEPTFGQFVMV
jgi:hypothetical protein